MNLITVLLRYRFVWLNLLFLGYLLLLQPGILGRLSSAVRYERQDWLMGAVLLAIQAIEMIALLLKRPVSRYYARHYPDAGGRGCRENGKVILFIFTPIFHLAFSSFLTILAFDLLGMKDNKALLLQCLYILLFFIVLTKEAFFVTLLLSLGGTGLAPAQPAGGSGSRWVERLNRWLMPPEITELTLKDLVKDIVGDLLLLGFAALVYTSSWELFIMSLFPQHRYGPIQLDEYLGVSIFFLLVFFTTRSVYLMQNLSIWQSRAARIFSWVSFLAVWLASLWSIPTR